MASNYPLRGGKHTLYQGGVLAEAFAWGPRWFGRPAGNATWGGLAHVSDVGLTILDAAGVVLARELGCGLGRRGGAGCGGRLAAAE